MIARSSTLATSRSQKTCPLRWLLLLLLIFKHNLTLVSRIDRPALILVHHLLFNALGRYSCQRSLHFFLVLKSWRQVDQLVQEVKRVGALVHRRMFYRLSHELFGLVKSDNCRVLLLMLTLFGLRLNCRILTLSHQRVGLQYWRQFLYLFERKEHFEDAINALNNIPIRFEFVQKCGQTLQFTSLKLIIELVTKRRFLNHFKNVFYVFQTHFDDWKTGRQSFMLFLQLLFPFFCLGFSIFAHILLLRAHVRSFTSLLRFSRFWLFWSLWTFSHIRNVLICSLWISKVIILQLVWLNDLVKAIVHLARSKRLDYQKQRSDQILDNFQILLIPLIFACIRIRVTLIITVLYCGIKAQFYPLKIERGYNLSRKIKTFSVWDFGLH